MNRSATFSRSWTRSTYARPSFPRRLRSSKDSTSGRSFSTRSSFVAATIGTFTPKASSVCRTASGSRCVTTGLPYAIDSIAKTPCQR